MGSAAVLLGNNQEAGRQGPDPICGPLFLPGLLWASSGPPGPTVGTSPSILSCCCRAEPQDLGRWSKLSRGRCFLSLGWSRGGPPTPGPGEDPRRQVPGRTPDDRSRGRQVPGRTPDARSGEDPRRQVPGRTGPGEDPRRQVPGRTPDARSRGGLVPFWTLLMDQEEPPELLCWRTFEDNMSTCGPDGVGHLG
ncbi:hypothetical protein D4764_04G0000280 [Takifugu flavidus]|uniref:Uncharacterized protein n=1 Tax=Takifugu flavidus TaxID=433684 RepID=A0A5C6N1J4_9TELE|nr:hypothetical protein D4764_04G0000280 [Takifugu flavidus]